MGPDEQHRLLEPFTRVGQHQAAAPGLGMGLFVARRIVELHGGRMTVESAPSKGLTFSVFLPLSPRESRVG